MDEVPSSAIGTHDSAYALATTGDELARLVAIDLEVGSTDQIFSGLEAFVSENVTRGTTTRANLIWAACDPPSRLQFGRGRRVMTAVKELGNVLANASDREIQSAFEAIRRGDFDEVQRLRDEPLGVLHPATAALSSEVRPYALLADGMLAYRDLSRETAPSGAEVEAVLESLAAAQVALAQVGENRGVFVADAAAAQSLERAGQIDAATEYWLRAADSAEFANQPPAVRNLVAARLKSHSARLKERLILEVEQERRAELRAMDADYGLRLERVREQHSELDAWARDGFDAVSARLASLGQADRGLGERIDRAAAEVDERQTRLERRADELERDAQAGAAVDADQREALRDLQAYRDALMSLGGLQRADSTLPTGSAPQTPDATRLAMHVMLDLFSAEGAERVAQVIVPPTSR